MALSDYERKLLKRAVKGDRSAFSDFYLRYQPSIYLELHGIVGSKSEADDLTSETFLRAWNAIGRFEDRGFSIEAWLKRIARNLAFSYLKRRGRERTNEDLEGYFATGKLPAEHAESELEGEAVRAALRDLPDVQRKILTMRFYEDLSYREVAAAVGKQEGTIRVIQHRALRSLRCLLEKGEDLLREERGSANSAAYTAHRGSD
jgi:RNA polymerase sigma-70 factor (ECF subfamily)